MNSVLDKAGFDPRIVESCGSGANGVMLLGECPGEMEADTGVPFYPGAQAGSVLERAIRRIGCSREQFAITNVVPYRPPNNYLDGASYEEEAINACDSILRKAIEQFAPRCIVALGSIATRTCTGLTGEKLGISHLVGYVLPSKFGIPVVACYHPSFLRRGATSRAANGEKGKRGGMSLFGVMMRCLRLAQEVANGSRHVVRPDYDCPGYIINPTEEQAIGFLYGAKIVMGYDAFARKKYEATGYLAYDIETPYSTAEDDAEERGGQINSIQFSLGPGTGIFFPWRDPYIIVAKQLLDLEIPKIGWNNWRFDDPRLRANGCTINGTNYDLMWAWHHAQPDLPRGLQFAAAMQGPAITQPSDKAWKYPWKHLDKAEPAFYGIVDVDVLSNMMVN